MIRYQIGYGLRIVFVGINPHPGSYRRGIPFSNNKMFWYLLHDAGLLSEPREVLKDDASLKRLYLHAFKKKYRFGLMNMIDRQTRSVTSLKRSEAVVGRERLLAAIKRYKPQTVCFVGKITYEMFADVQQVSYGWQPPIGSSKIFVMHAPHHGPASVRIKELRELCKVADRQLHFDA